jgi:hypothetical protein
MNQIQVIRPYFHAGTWVFDDEAKGLVKEPFVEGIPGIINFLLGLHLNQHSTKKGFRLLFSSEPFPNITAKLTWEAEEAGGNWYALDGSSMEGWLCPALLKYFDKAPKTIYVQAEAL